MKDSDTLIEEYFQDNIFEYRDLWSTIEISDIKETLEDNNEEYDEDILQDIYDYVLNIQEDLQQEEKDCEKEDLLYAIGRAIDDNSEHLSYIDIGILLTKQASDYFHYE